MPDTYTMTPFHPRWDEFADRMEGNEGCNFRPKPKPDEHGETCWTCFRDFRATRKILEDMGGFDVEASILFFRVNGGNCDCTILFNVDDDDRRASLAEEAVRLLMANGDRAERAAELTAADAASRSEYSQSPEYQAGQTALTELHRLAAKPDGWSDESA